MQKQLNNIQALRFFAALIVVFVHIPLIRFSGSGISPSLFGGGAVGVDIFFVISGFIMCFVTSGMRTGPASAAEFLCRRFLRIAPIYWLFTAVAAYLSYISVNCPSGLSVCPFWLGQYFPFDSYQLGVILRSATFTHFSSTPIFAVGWTLIYEVWFYVAMALIIATRANRSIVFAGWASAIIANAIIDHSFQWPGPLYTLLNPYMLEFMLGAVVFRQWKASRLMLTPLVAALIAFILAATALSTRANIEQFGLMRATLWGGISYCIVGIALALEGRIKVPQAIVFGGSISYSLYLAHWLVMTTVPSLLDMYGISFGPIMFSTCLVLISLALASLLHVAIEYPIHRATRRLVTTVFATASVSSPVSEAGQK